MVARFGLAWTVGLVFGSRPSHSHRGRTCAARKPGSAGARAGDGGTVVVGWRPDFLLIVLLPPVWELGLGLDCRIFFKKKLRNIHLPQELWHGGSWCRQQQSVDLSRRASFLPPYHHAAWWILFTLQCCDYQELR
jgi:hypothetical protein